MVKFPITAYTRIKSLLYLNKKPTNNSLRSNMEELCMRVFITGATGFVGSAVVANLISAGHKIVGLARSEAAAKLLLAAGAEVHRGDLQDLDSLRSGAAAADAVIHTGFIHDFARFKEVCGVDARAIDALSSVLAGSDKPLIVTAGLAHIASGRPANEDDSGPLVTDAYPRVSEQQAALAAARKIRVSVVRLAPSVHGDGDHGFVSFLINIAREKGVSAYVGEGLNRWAAVHRHDAAQLYRLVLERDSVGANYHGAAEEGVALRDIAEAIGRGLNLPVVSVSRDEAINHFGWFTTFTVLDCPASSAKTRAQLGWHPTQVGLISDINQGRYFSI
jgi:nucleoside-diphosphate-sugar epimerase